MNDIKPVTEERIRIAKQFGLVNVESAALSCRRAGLPFWAACALLQKESMGRNVYGNDVGGALAGFPGTVNRDNFAVFRWMVIDKGMTSNGVGPCQITYAGARRQDGTRDGGFFRQMAERNLMPFFVEHNMLFGFELLKDYHEDGKSWFAAGVRYNGADQYGEDLVEKINEWRDRLKIKGGDVR